MVLEQLDIHRQRKKPWLKPHTLYKINSKWIIDLNVKHKIITILEDIGKNIWELGLARSTWPDTKSKSINWASSKLKTSAMKDPFKKRKATDWKYF